MFCELCGKCAFFRGGPIAQNGCPKCGGFFSGGQTKVSRDDAPPRDTGPSSDDEGPSIDYRASTDDIYYTSDDSYGSEYSSPPSTYSSSTPSSGGNGVGLILVVVIGVVLLMMFGGRQQKESRQPQDQNQSFNNKQSQASGIARQKMMGEIERINRITWIENSSTQQPEWEPLPWDFEHEHAPVQKLLPDGPKNILLQNAGEDIEDCISKPIGERYKNDPIKTFGYSTIRDNGEVIGYFVTGRCYISGVGRNAYIYWLIGQRKDGSSEFIEKARTWGEAFDAAFFRNRIREKIGDN